jgi:hypothetical protein
MNKLLTELQYYRKVQDITLQVYKSHLNRLAVFITGFNYDSNDFLLEEYEKVSKYIDTLTTSVKKKNGIFHPSCIKPSRT